MPEYNPKTDCCPPFNPAPWDGKTHEWRDKKFIKDKVRCAMHMPLNFGAVMKKLTALVEKSGAAMPDYVCLSDHTSLFNMDVYLAVDKEIPGANNVTLSGTFVSKVYEGDFGKTGEWCKDFAAYIKQSGRTMTKMYMWYTTCPKCAKKYGHNYVVILGQVAS